MNQTKLDLDDEDPVPLKDFSVLGPRSLDLQELWVMAEQRELWDFTGKVAVFDYVLCEGRVLAVPGRLWV